MNSLVLLPASAKNAAIAVHPDAGRYLCRFDIRSGSSNRIYRISYDSAPGSLCWKCSCPGNIRHGDCKHLQAMGLPGRRKGKSLEWARKLKGMK